MSEIRATTISDAAGTGPIALTGQSAAKAWASYDNTSTLLDSFNVASAVDGATTGQTTVNFTNSMSDENYAVHATCNRSSGARFVSSSFMTTSSYDTFTFDGTTRAERSVGTMVTGDLA